MLGDGSGRRLFVSFIEWDSNGDAQEFFDAYQKFIGQKRKWVVQDVDGDTALWHSDDRSVLLRVDNDRTVIIIGPDTETVEQIAALLT